MRRKWSQNAHYGSRGEGAEGAVFRFSWNATCFLLSPQIQSIMKTTKSWFTLVELAAMLVCVALMTALLLPQIFFRKGIENTRSKARTISCTGNLKQIALSATMYTQDYDETLPLVQEHYRTKYVNVATPGDSWYGLINVYVTNEKSFECTADIFKVNATELMGSDDRFLLSYGFNAVCNASSASDYGKWSRVAPNMTVENPSATLMVADTGKVHGALYPFVGSDMEACGYLAYRHGDNFNVAFMDGHAANFTNKHNHRVPDKIKLGLISTAY